MEQPPLPKGRGAALLAAYKKAQEKKLGVQVEQVEEPPKPRGRAELLKRILERRKVGASTSETVTEAVSDITTSLKNVELESEAREAPERGETVQFRGESGKPIRASTNYIRLDILEDKGVFEYEVRFNPEVDARNHRLSLVNQVMRELGSVKVFDGGSVLYLPQQMPDGEFPVSLRSDPDKQYMLRIIYKKKKNMCDRECLHLYNVLFKRIMYILMYSPMGRSYFDTHHSIMIPQHKLEIYPGFAVSVDELEGGLMLCLDTQHRVLRNQTAYELLQEIRVSSKDMSRFKETARQTLIGQCVFTRYNNQTYIVDDIGWDITPEDTFETRDGGVISFLDYYKKQHNLTITDHTQPMLVHRKVIKQSGTAQKTDRLICLVPELCTLTGMTDSMRNDFTVMKDVALHTRVTPHQRMSAMRVYLENVKKSEKAQEVLAGWGLKISGCTIDIHARKLNNEMVWFGDNQSCQTNDNADWNRALGENKVTGPVDILEWLVVFTPRDAQITRRFVEMMVKMGDVMGCRICPPKQVQLRSDTNDCYLKACQENIKETTQVIVFVVPSIRSDRYGLIKKVCCTQIPIPSQVVTARTLSNPNRLRAIVQKIALQIVCKLGGSLWNIRFPMQGWMIVGIDVYHGGTNSTSACGLVCSLNENISRWFSLVNFQEKELGDYYKMAFVKMLERYRNENNRFPAKLVIYRDGVSDGQLDQVRRYEVAQIEEVIKEFKLDITLCFIVVQKRISTRLFEVGRDDAKNPPPGTLMDHTVTRRTQKDFFLVSQSVRQGTVNPTHYIVVHDTINLKADIVQRLSYKLCHLYYNWAGTIRVPAPCQYAHKLAGLVGQHIKKIPSATLSDKLFYL